MMIKTVTIQKRKKKFLKKMKAKTKQTVIMKI